VTQHERACAAKSDAERQQALEQRFECPEAGCGKWYHCRSSFIRHKRLKHPKSSPPEGARPPPALPAAHIRIRLRGAGNASLPLRTVHVWLRGVGSVSQLSSELPRPDHAPHAHAQQAPADTSHGASHGLPPLVTSPALVEPHALDETQARRKRARGRVCMASSSDDDSD